ncbi:MAG: N-acetylmuramoyl-L-alanine amidase, partial [Candidatus Zixiibacteriota bacterium]
LTNESSVDVSGSDDLSGIVNDMIQNVYVDVSADLSAIIQSEFRKSLGIPSRGVDQAGFVVLNQVYMPSALVEVAFISNSKEEKLLRNKKFRKKVARALYESLKRFKRKYERNP